MGGSPLEGHPWAAPSVLGRSRGSRGRVVSVEMGWARGGTGGTQEGAGRDWDMAGGYGTGPQHWDTALVALHSPTTRPVTSLAYGTCPQLCHVPRVPLVSPCQDGHSGTPWVSLMGQTRIPQCHQCHYVPALRSQWPPGRGHGSHSPSSRVPSTGGHGGSGVPTVAPALVSLVSPGPGLCRRHVGPTRPRPVVTSASSRQRGDFKGNRVEPAQKMGVNTSGGTDTGPGDRRGLGEGLRGAPTPGLHWGG